MVSPVKEKTIKTRIITALFALPLLILLVQYANQGLFNVLVLLVTLVALFEFYEMALPSGRLPERSVALSFGLLFAAFVFWGQLHTALLVLCVTLLLLAIVYLFRFQDLSKVIHQLSTTIFGLLYIPFLLGHLPLLRSLDNGRSWVFMVLVIAMVGDSAAYFVGSALGKRKLYPAISPNKSVEGALGGFAGSILGALIFRFLFFPQTDIAVVVFLAAVLSVLAQLGDLFESMLKRSFQVKDSGTIIPGHGGVLDRLDSLLFTFPAAYYLIGYFG